ncbi:MAG: glycoside hydrolase family 13 protein [Bifidobacteriaceae bacterium]|jgi:glycosidase|nr:glycoside hydrolase family 13 protein [Bifidobacteriaceae bacterium]
MIAETSRSGNPLADGAGPGERVGAIGGTEDLAPPGSPDRFEPDAPDWLHDAVDYFQIDHRLGDEDAFRRLLESAHARGIRIVLDGVFNHCGDAHPYFRDVTVNEARSEYVNWYSVDGFPVVSEPTPNYRTFADCANLPKWNVYNPLVRRHHLEVARHWLELGIDGWRLDVPWLVPRGFWTEFRRLVKQINPGAYIVAEEWRQPEPWLQGDTCDGTMNYAPREPVLEFTADGSIDAAQLADRVNSLFARIPAGFQRGLLNLLGSHDTERVTTRHGGQTGRCLLAHALIFGCAGTPMLYYGDELGLRGGGDPGCRGAMPWNSAGWPEDFLASIRALAQARRESAPLRRGSQEVLALGPDTVAVRRELDGEVAAVIAHRGGGVAIDPCQLGLGPARVLCGGAEVRAGRYTLEPDSFLALAGPALPHQRS